MNLITKLDDERLRKECLPLPMGETAVLFYYSLAAALAQLADEKQKVANLEEYMLKGIAFRDELQAQLCAAREAMFRVEASFGNLGDTIAGMETQDLFSEAIVALSSSSPCPHAKEAKRLREAVEWALTDPITTEDVVLKQWIIFWREDLKHRLQRAGAASTSPALCCCCREEAIRIVARYTDTDRPLIDHIIEDLRGEK